MEIFVNLVAGVLGLIPLILVFFIPALFGMATLKERGAAYKVKAGIWFAIGLAGVVFVEVAFRHVSAVQVASTVGISVVQFAVALAFAALTVYKLAD